MQGLTRDAPSVSSLYQSSGGIETVAGCLTSHSGQSRFGQSRLSQSRLSQSCVGQSCVGLSRQELAGPRLAQQRQGTRVFYHRHPADQN